MKRDLDVGGEAGGIGVLAGNGAQGAARDGVGVSLGDLVRVEGVVVVTDDQGGDVDRPPTLVGLEPGKARRMTAFCAARGRVSWPRRDAEAAGEMLRTVW